MEVWGNGLLSSLTVVWLWPLYTAKALYGITSEILTWPRGELYQNLGCPLRRLAKTNAWWPSHAPPALSPRTKFTGDLDICPLKIPRFSISNKLWREGIEPFHETRICHEIKPPHTPPPPPPRVNNLVWNLFLWAGPPVPLVYLYWLS